MLLSISKILGNVSLLLNYYSYNRGIERGPRRGYKMSQKIDYKEIQVIIS